MQKYTYNLEFIDSETGEINDLNYFITSITDLTFEEMVERVAILKQLYIEITNAYRINELKFINAMEEKSAKKFVNDDIEIKLTYQYNYDYDTEYVHKIKELIDENEFKKIFTEQYKVNRTLLKSIYTLGGDVKNYIDKMETKTIKKPTVSVISKNK